MVEICRAVYSVCMEGVNVGMFSVRARAIAAIEHCSSSDNPVVTDLVKTAVTPRSTDRLSAPQMLVKTPTVQASVQSHRQSGLIITLCKTF